MKKNTSTMVSTFSLAAIVLFTAIALFSCGRDNNSPTASTPGGGQVPEVPEVPVPPPNVQQVDCDTAPAVQLVTMQTVTINDKAVERFEPPSVNIEKNEIVQWINKDDHNWRVKSADDVPVDNSFDSAYFGPGQSYCLKFNVPGLFNYHCADSVRGVVNVGTLE